MANKAQGGGYRWGGLPCRTGAEEVPVKGFKHRKVSPHGQIYVLNLASLQRKSGGLKACRQKDHSGSKCKNEDFTKAVIRDDYFSFLNI